MTEDRYVVTRAEIAEMEGLRKAHFLNPEAVRINRSLGDRTGLTGIGFHVVEVAPGLETTEHHRHHHEDECVYVLEGEALARIGDAEFPIGAGDFVGYRKGGAAHTLRNTGSGPLRLIVVGERRAHDVVDYPRCGKRLFKNEGMAWNLIARDAIETPVAGAKA